MKKENFMVTKFMVTIPGIEPRSDKVATEEGSDGVEDMRGKTH